MSKKKKFKEKYIRERIGKKYTSYQVDIPYTATDGTRTHFVKTFRSSDYQYDAAMALIAARLERDKALQEINLNTIRSKIPTVGWFYQKSWDLMPRSLNTRMRHDAVYNKAMADYQNIELSKVKIQTVQECVNRYAENQTKTNITYIVAIWKEIYKTALMLGYPVTDFTSAIIVPKSKIVKKKINQSVDPGDVETLLVCVLENQSWEKNDNIHLAVYYFLNILYYTGCRPAEVFPLEKSDIHSDYISITKQLGSDKDHVNIVVPTKTEKSYRNVPVSDEFKPVLEEMLLWAKYDRIFTDPMTGDYYNIVKFGQYLRRVARNNNIDFHPYMLRHLLSSDLVREKNTMVARDILGHASSSMTLGYARTTNDDLKSALKSRSLKIAENLPKNNLSIIGKNQLLKTYQIGKFALIIRYLAVLRQL